MLDFYATYKHTAHEKYNSWNRKLEYLKKI